MNKNHNQYLNTSMIIKNSYTVSFQHPNNGKYQRLVLTEHFQYNACNTKAFKLVIYKKWTFYSPKISCCADRSLQSTARNTALEAMAVL